MKYNIWLILVLQIARVLSQRIIEVTNTITFYGESEDETLKQLDQVRLASMKNYQTKPAYESNQTLTTYNYTMQNNSANTSKNVSMKLCYVQSENQTNYETFVEQCKNNISKSNSTTDNGTVWILVSSYPEDLDQEENLDVMIRSSNDSSVQGLILIQ